MRRTIGGRLITLSTLFIGIFLCSLAIIALGFAFQTYIQSLVGDSETLLDETVNSIEKSDVRNATDAARVMAPRLFRRALLITFIDDDSRVTVYHRQFDPRGVPPVIVAHVRDDRSGQPVADEPLARAVLGSASIAGLRVLRAHVHGIDIAVSDNDPVVVQEVSDYVPWLAIIGGIIVLATILIGGILNRSALRPLDEVTQALERVAHGDFTTQFVESDVEGDLGFLARAYNRAVARVEGAFAERDEANAAMRRFVADAGHQLRTPLTVIRGFIAMLAETENQKSAAEYAHILHVMNQQSSLMASLIEKLILLDRWEHDAVTDLRPLDVMRLSEDIVTRTAEAHPMRRIWLSAPLEAEILVRADPMEITYALTNLLDNALAYTDGSVTVDITQKPEVVQIEVTDEGPGMPFEVVAHAFDRFFRGDRRDIAGSGLGLAIAKRAVERAGGTIVLRSSVLQGTIVSIRLPRIVAVIPPAVAEGSV